MCMFSFTMPYAIPPIRAIALKITKPYFISLPLNPQCLNLRANIGISAIRSHELTMMPIRSRGREYAQNIICVPSPTMSEPQKRALAGVGSPMNDVVWRVSRLNFASLRAEKAAMMYARKGITLRHPSRNEG